MEKEYVYTNVQELITPKGVFAVYDGDKKIPFSVMRNSMDMPCKVYGNSDG